MKKSKLFLLITLGITLFSVSCKDDEASTTPNGENPTSTVCYLKEVKQNEVIVQKFEYENNILTKMITNDTLGNETSYNTFEYDNNKLIKINMYDDDTLWQYAECDRTNGRLIKRRRFSDGTLIMYDTLIYNSNNKVEKVDFYNTNNTIIMSQRMIWDNNNIIDTKLYQNNGGELAFYYGFSYSNFDIKKSPYSPSCFNDIFFTGDNNYTTMKFYSLSDTSSGDYVYEYNSYGYPIKSTYDDNVLEYIYDCH